MDMDGLFSRYLARLRLTLFVTYQGVTGAALISCILLLHTQVGTGASASCLIYRHRGTGFGLVR